MDHFQKVAAKTLHVKITDTKERKSLRVTLSHSCRTTSCDSKSKGDVSQLTDSLLPEVMLKMTMMHENLPPYHKRPYPQSEGTQSLPNAMWTSCLKPTAKGGATSRSRLARSIEPLLHPTSGPRTKKPYSASVYKTGTRPTVTHALINLELLLSSLSHGRHLRPPQDLHTGCDPHNQSDLPKRGPGQKGACPSPLCESLS